jgi:hypothetical protein
MILPRQSSCRGLSRENESLNDKSWVQVHHDLDKYVNMNFVVELVWHERDEEWDIITVNNSKFRITDPDTVRKIADHLAASKI